MRELRFWSALASAALWLGAATMLAPVAWMVATSLKAPSAAVSYPLELIPRIQQTWRDPQSSKAYPVFWTQLNGRRVKVARLGLSAGRVLVMPIEGLHKGHTFSLPLYRSVSGRLVPTLRPARRLFIRWQNYPEAWHALKLRHPWMAFRLGPLRFSGIKIRDAFLAFYLNSLLVSLAVTLGQVLTCSLAAFAFARLRFPGRDAIFLSYLATMMVPHVVTMIPVFILLRSLRLIDTYSALILPAIFSAYGTFMLRQFFLSVPRELEDAARIDGCSHWQVYRYIIIPLSRPAISALAVFAFLVTWNSFMWPLIVINSTEKMPLMLGLYAFMGQHSIDWHLLMAASVMTIAPAVLAFILAQRHFIQALLVKPIPG